MKYLEITADTNDADYISHREEISDEQLVKFIPLIEAIKNFKPYTIESPTGYKNHCHNNFTTGECCREDLGEKSVYEIYKDAADEHTIGLFVEKYCPTWEYGIHTIKSIEVFEIHNRQRLL